MESNPANKIKDSMWDFLKDGGQDADISTLKSAVYSLIQMTTQKDAGQRGNVNNIPFEVLELLKWQIVCEACALVLSGKLDDLEGLKGDSTRTA